MRSYVCVVFVAVVVVTGLYGCGGGEPLPEGPADAGKTIEATVEACHFYLDRGVYTRLRTVLTADSVGSLPNKDDRGRLRRTKGISRGFAFEHVEESEGEATVYYRTWIRAEAQAKGGHPRVARLVKEGGLWKFDAAASKDLTSGITKGRDESGFYDGTEEWWK